MFFRDMKIRTKSSTWQKNVQSNGLSQQVVVYMQYYHCVYPFPKQAQAFTRLQYKSFENTVGKGEIARNEQFLLFPQYFLLFPPFPSNSKLSPANSFGLKESKIWRLGKG